MYKTLAEILEVEAWKPTYETFTDAYNDKMHNITFAPELLPHIAYKMFDEGATPEQVADAVKGIGPEKAKRLKEERDSGVPAHSATGHPVRVRGNGPYQRKLPEDNWVKLNVAPEVLQEWKRIAKQRKRTVESIVMEAATQKFKRLDR